MEIIVSGSKLQRISNQPSTVLIITDKKQQENVKYFSYLRSIITNDAKFTSEIKSSIVTAKADQPEENYFHEHIGIKFKEETSALLHLESSFLRCRNVDTLENR